MPLHGIYPAPLSGQSAYLQYATIIRRVGPWRRAYSRGLSHMGFHPLRRIVPLRGTPSCAFGAALLQGPTREGLSHMGFHSAAASCASSRHCNPLPLARPFSKGLRAGIISHRLSCRCDELCLFEALQSSPFGAALLQGPMRGSNAIKLSGRSSLAPHRGSCPKGLCKRTGFLGVKRRENPVRRHFERSEMRGLRSGIA